MKTHHRDKCGLVQKNKTEQKASMQRHANIKSKLLMLAHDPTSRPFTTTIRTNFSTLRRVEEKELNTLRHNKSKIEQTVFSLEHQQISARQTVLFRQNQIQQQSTAKTNTRSKIITGKNLGFRYRWTHLGTIRRVPRPSQSRKQSTTNN